MNTKLKIHSYLKMARQRNTVAAMFLAFIFLFMHSGCGKEDKFIFLTVFDTPTYSIQPGVISDEVDIICSISVMEEGSSVEQNIPMIAIKNFTYEKGYEYLLKVEKTSNKDCLYSLEEIVSKSLRYEVVPIVISVTSELVPIGPEGELNERIIVKEDENSDFLMPYSFKIEGFEYEKGFNYQLKVKKTVITVPPQTGFGLFILYELTEIISKTLKTQ